MDFLLTPDERFDGLGDFPFAPRFVDVEPGGLRMHYVDEGPRGAPVVVLLHGEPSWSYLYRFMIPALVKAELRVLAPDLIGFGKSAKPTHIEDYSYLRHMQWLRSWFEQLDLKGVTLFGQDWGALLGLRLLAELEPRFSAAMIGNGYLPTGERPTLRNGGWLNAAAFLTWRTFALRSPWFPVSQIISVGCQRKLSPTERRAYDAPFPSARYLAGARAFPALVPISPKDPAREANLAAWATLERWDKPFETAFSTGDPIMGGLDRRLQARIPGAKGRDHSRVPGGHFLQEDASPQLAERLARLALSSPRQARAAQ